MRKNSIDAYDLPALVASYDADIRCYVVFSSYSLHHLSFKEKTGVIKQALGSLHPGGWFVKADIIVILVGV